MEAAAATGPSAARQTIAMETLAVEAAMEAAPAPGRSERLGAAATRRLIAHPAAVWRIHLPAMVLLAVVWQGQQQPRLERLSWPHRLERPSLQPHPRLTRLSTAAGALAHVVPAQQSGRELLVARQRRACKPLSRLSS